MPPIQDATPEQRRQFVQAYLAGEMAQERGSIRDRCRRHTSAQRVSKGPGTRGYWNALGFIYGYSDRSTYL